MVSEFLVHAIAEENLECDRLGSCTVREKRALSSNIMKSTTCCIITGLLFKSVV
jgi:hypothetical protein